MLQKVTQILWSLLIWSHLSWSKNFGPSFDSIFFLAKSQKFHLFLKNSQYNFCTLWRQRWSPWPRRWWTECRTILQSWGRWKWAKFWRSDTGRWSPSECSPEKWKRNWKCLKSKILIVRQLIGTLTISLLFKMG